MKKIFILIFCFLFFQTQVFADNQRQKYYEQDENLCQIRQTMQEYINKEGRRNAIILTYFIPWKGDSKSFFEKLNNEGYKLLKNKNDMYKYISFYYIFKIMRYCQDFIKEEKLFSQEIIVDDREWLFLTKTTKLLVLIYNELARVNNPNFKEIINNSYQQEHEKSFPDIEKELKDYVKKSGKKALLQKQFKQNKTSKERTLINVVVDEYKKQSKVDKESINLICCYFISIMMLNSIDYTERSIYPKPIIVDNHYWEMIEPNIRLMLTKHNLVVKIYNE